jgi:Uncharacterized conserved protein related to C-terminal domain of eukaryotic chaperone, SACSIN
MAKLFEKSDRDKEVAYLLLEKGYYPEACFHSEMAVELKLKGISVEAAGAIKMTYWIAFEADDNFSSISSCFILLSLESNLINEASMSI